MYQFALQYFDGGDAWFTPVAKIAVDQTAFALIWNSLYLVMLGEQSSPKQLTALILVFKLPYIHALCL